jgi:hypothetical protein
MAAHYLSAGPPAQLPAGHVIIGYTLDYVVRQGFRGNCKHATVKDWCILKYTDNICEDDNHVEQDGIGSDSLWQNILSVDSYRGRKWIWCEGLHDLFVSGCFYDYLDKGDFDAGYNANHEERRHGPNKGKHFKGFVLDSGTPCIGLVRSALSGAVLQFVCTSNYGATTRNAECSSREAAHRTAKWVMAYCRLIRDYWHNEYKPTAAGIAWAAFRKGYNECDVLIHDNEEVMKLERRAVFPGRNQCWRLGNIHGDSYHLDIVSAYTAIGVDGLFPVRLYGTGTTNTGELWKAIADGWLVIADVTLSDKRGRFPYRDRTGVYYPRGTYETTLCGPELIESLNSNAVDSVAFVAMYAAGKVFSRWSGSMLALRRLSVNSSVPGLRGSIKLTTNCLYGKFAGRNRVWKKCTCNRSAHRWDTWLQNDPGYSHSCTTNGGMQGRSGGGNGNAPGVLTRWRTIVGTTEFSTESNTNGESAAAVLAYLASHCRVQLAKCIDTVGDENMIYCDTDGFYCNEHGYNNLLESGMIGNGEPGTLRLVKVVDNLCIYGLKHLTVGESDWTHAGVPDSAVLEDGKFTWQIPESMYQGLSRKSPPNGRITLHSHVPSVQYLHGNVQPDGRVRPIQPLVFGGYVNGGKANCGGPRNRTADSRLHRSGDVAGIEAQEETGSYPRIRGGSFEQDQGR